MSVRKVMLPLAVMAGLSACSAFEPDYYNCDDRISSYAEGSRSSLEASITGQNVEARFNGVSARCYDTDGVTIMEVGIGLKILRDLNDNVEVAPVNVPIATALLDGQDEVLSYETFSYDMQFPDGVRVLYPLVRREFTLNLDGRVIMALTPEQLIP